MAQHSFGNRHTREDLAEHLFGARLDSPTLMRALEWIRKRLPSDTDKDARNTKMFMLYFGFDGGTVDSHGLAVRFDLTASAVTKAMRNMREWLLKEVRREGVSAGDFMSGESGE